MNPKHRPALITAILALITVALFAFIFTIPALAQDTNAVAPGNAPQIVAGGLEQTIVDFAVAHPWFLTFLALIGTLRLVIKPIMAALHFFALQTETEFDNKVIDAIERSWYYTMFLFAIDWLTSIKLPAKSSSSSVNKSLSLLCVLGVLSVSLTACSPLHPDGVYKSDQILHKSELVTTTSYEVIHTYVTWEKENRAALASIPEIKQSADVMRANAKQWFATANALRDAYAAAPTPENKDALATSLAVLQTALNEAVKYMAQAAGGASVPASLVN